MPDEPRKNNPQPSSRPSAAVDGPSEGRPLWRGIVARLLYGLAAVAALVVGYFLIVPSRIDPVAYEPPPAPKLEGPLAVNDKLAQCETLALGEVQGPEDVEVDAQGRVYAGVVGGQVVRLKDDGSPETFADTGGRPFGMDFDPYGNLIVCDGIKGLLAIDPQGKITPLVTEADGIALGFTDDVDVARDGTIYFSDASDKFGVNEYLLDLLEGCPHGRLLAYDPRSGQTRVLLKDLYFANGVALSANEDFVLVNETYRHRITRYWLRGPNQGKSDVFLDNIPGYPDGVSSNGRGTFWVAVFAPRNADADRMANRPWLKSVVAKLPTLFWPKPDHYAMVLAVDEQGKIQQSLQDPKGDKIWGISSATERGGYLYLGTLHGDRIGRYKL